MSNRWYLRIGYYEQYAPRIDLFKCRRISRITNHQSSITLSPISSSNLLGISLIRWLVIIFSFISNASVIFSLPLTARHAFLSRTWGSMSHVTSPFHSRTYIDPNLPSAIFGDVVVHTSSNWHKTTAGTNAGNYGRTRARILMEMSNPEIPPHPFHIREIREEDLGLASKILAHAFIDEVGKKNFFTQRIEHMNSYLSLKSRFETFRYADRSGALQCMLVACIDSSKESQNRVIGFCEVDDRPPGGEKDPAPRPYISNLVVDEKFRRLGVATALVGESEVIVRNDWGKPRLHLRVYDKNDAAKSMYHQCGYGVVGSSQAFTAKEKTVLLLVKEL